MTTHVLVVIAFTIGLATPVSAIVIRHDRKDSLYVELGQQLHGVCHLNLQHENAPPDGEGVLIDSLWVLTAAHVAVEIQPGHTMTVVGPGIAVQVQAEAIILHPQWDGGAHDLALVRLKRPVENVDPVPVYRLRDEAGKTITVCGTGDFGTGVTGPESNDGELRGATNRVDEVSDHWLKFRFDEVTHATDLEGISGPGDSGGPAFLFQGKSCFVAGVSSGQSTRDTGGREGVYGVREYYTRISSYCAWIDEVRDSHSAN